MNITNEERIMLTPQKINEIALKRQENAARKVKRLQENSQENNAKPSAV